MELSSVIEKDICPKREFVFNCGRYSLKLGRTTKIMGILNLTCDSFSGDGIHQDPERAKDFALKMAEDGADIIDIGGESTRPGAESISAGEEKERILPVIKRLAGEIEIPISIDTTKAEVASAALEEGASIVNDISGLKFDRQMAGVAARFQAGCVLMHIKGRPQNMQQNPYYKDLFEEIIESLRESISIAEGAGIGRDSMAIDPGIGFGKTTEHNLQIIRELRKFAVLERPVLIGLSRKSFIGNVLNLPVEKRLPGTAAAVAVSILNGAHIVRVHDVKAMAETVKMVDTIINC